MLVGKKWLEISYIKQVMDSRSGEGYKFLQCGEADFSLHVVICLHGIQMHLHHVLGQTLGVGEEEAGREGPEKR